MAETHPDSGAGPNNVIVLRPDGTRPIEGATQEEPAEVIPRQCTARSTTSGQRCRKSAIKGGTVCTVHGGRAPQVKERARLRLANLVDPAITTLAREMAGATASADRQRAANSILDRAGLSRAASPDLELARTLLLDRLITLQAQQSQGMSE